jgi:regulator of replication initiation timing
MNAFINLDDGTPIYYEGDLAIGVPCFLDEDMTMPLADGTYPLADGKTLMVADGFVTEIHESGGMDKTAEIESLKNTITELQNKLSATETEKEKLNETNAAIATEVDALKVEINNFRKVVIGAEKKSAEKKAEVVGEDAPQWKQVLHRVRSNRK